VHIIGDVIGRLLTFTELSPEAAREAMLAIMPGPAADMLLAAYGAALGLPAHITSTIGEVTGIPARSFGDWALDRAEDFVVRG
jgi:hypothetical protein